MPHELIRSGPPLTYVIFGLVLLLAVKYRPFGGALGPVDLVASGLAAWALVRLVLLSPLEEEPIPWSLAGREAGTLLAGIVLFRLARIPELQPAILRGVALGLTLMLTIEAYQLLAGVERLVALEYTTGEGFNYYTAAGDYRPFGTFRAPTVFGAYVAMVGAVVVVTAQRRFALIFGAITVALIFTQTRSAWLGFALAMMFGFVSQSPLRRFQSVLLAIPLAWFGLVLAVLRPDATAQLWTRVQSIASGDDPSSTTRIILWDGVLRAVEQGHAMIGFGARDWTEVMYQRVGLTALLGHAHSNYFQELFQYGAIGLGLFVALMLSFLLAIRRSRVQVDRKMNTAALAALAVFAVDSIFNNSLSSFNFLATLFLLVGLGCARPTPQSLAAVPRVAFVVGMPNSGLATRPPA